MWKLFHVSQSMKDKNEMKTAKGEHRASGVLLFQH